jgi:hypothetical protein
MPASDGGPMLWPTFAVVKVWDEWNLDTNRYGFVDVTGALVVPARYEGYSYCRNQAGRVSFVIAASAGRKADVLDLTGKVIAHAPTDSAVCGPAGSIVFIRWFDAELGHHEDGIMDVATGRILLPLVRGRHVQVLGDQVLVNVSEPGGEYFYNPRTGQRTPHPGWLTDTEADLETEAPALPASTKKDGGRIGFLDLSGRWVAKADFVEASAFSGGHAVVKLGENRFTFLDARMRRAGGEWASIAAVAVHPSERVVGGYVVQGVAGQALLGADLRVISAPGAGTIDCGWQAHGACSVLGTDGRSSLVVLPEGTATAIPEGYSQALSSTFVADKVAADNDAAKRILALASGGVAQLEAQSSCRGVGTAWAACDAPGAMLPPVVIDSQGRRTAFATIEAASDPAQSGLAAYYWAVAGRYQGFVDESGNWRYRESRYTRVED